MSCSSYLSKFHQVLRLPRNPSSASATKSDTHAWPSPHMKHHWDTNLQTHQTAPATQNDNPKSTFTKYWACHEKWHLSFTKYCACHEKWHLDFTKNCACHENDIWPSPDTAIATKKWHLTSPSTAPAKKNDSCPKKTEIYCLLVLSDSITWDFIS